MKYWTMRDGTKIALSDMSDRHLENTLKMVGRQLDSYPGESYSVNSLNLNRLRQLTTAHKALRREQVRRQPKLPSIIQPEEVAKFRIYDER